MNVMSGVRKDFIASHLRSQINTLRSVLSIIEEENDHTCGYAEENLKQVETNLRKIRKLCTDN
jgi:hypothetical protein